MTTCGLCLQGVFTRKKKYIQDFSTSDFGTDCEVQLGPMKLKQHTMSVLLVFGREDAQSDGFWWAADRAGYKCNISRNAEGALECYLDKHHDVVIIDNRHSKNIDAEALCRSIRATKSSKHTIVIAVTKKHTGEKEEPSIVPLLTAGFNWRFIENHNLGTCINELMSIEHGELRSQLKLRACDALFTALDNTRDAVEITSKDHIVQYVNPSFERLTGYTIEELLGRNMRDLPKSDKNKGDLQDIINTQIRKGKHWEGAMYCKKKSGEQTSMICHIAPVEGPGGKVRHYVTIRRPMHPEHMALEKIKDSDLNSDLYRCLTDYRLPCKGSGVRSLSIDGILHSVKRRDSIARIHSMTIEAPITKVINIINAAQENSPMTVVESLDRVLEILRTTELYAPNQHQDEDSMANDYVGGLMSTNSIKRRFSSNEIHQHTKSNHHLPTNTPTVLSLVPVEIQTILEKECTWDFDVIELEKVTGKKPLVYLGLETFNRFGVGEFLGVDDTVLRNWLQSIESNYHSTNSYHNSTHAADVLHATAYFLDREKLKNLFDTMDEVAALIAAIVHDVDHPGRTNSFLVNEGNELAILYNDLAVLENHHVAMAFKLTAKDDRVNIFKNLQKDEFRALRQLIIDMVMATEMTRHFEHLSKFVNCTKIITKCEENLSMLGSTSPENSLAPLNSPENRTLIRRMVIKCADVANPTRPLHLCKDWAIRIANEYFQQTDEEKRLNLPVVMPIFDRKTCSIPKSQTSFYSFFINDMFAAWDAFCDLPELITHLQCNQNYWKEEEEKEQTTAVSG